MVRQQAFTILASAAASAAATAALLFLWNPGEPARPMVAERVVDADAGRARDELQRRCDDLATRCEELERTVAELHFFPAASRVDAKLLQESSKAIGAPSDQ
jgi:hypothetical protein